MLNLYKYKKRMFTMKAWLPPRIHACTFLKFIWRSVYYKKCSWLYYTYAYMYSRTFGTQTLFLAHVLDYIFFLFPFIPKYMNFINFSTYINFNPYNWVFLLFIDCIWLQVYNIKGKIYRQEKQGWCVIKLFFVII